MAWPRAACGMLVNRTACSSDVRRSRFRNGARREYRCAEGRKFLCSRDSIFWVSSRVWRGAKSKSSKSYATTNLTPLQGRLVAMEFAHEHKLKDAILASGASKDAVIPVWRTSQHCAAWRGKQLQDSFTFGS